MKGDFLFANPASQHQSGKNSRKVINQVTQFIHEHFHLETSSHRLIYHSGATEGINSIVKGMNELARRQNKKLILMTSPLDHPCVLEAQDWLSDHGGEFIFYAINEKGEILWEELGDLVAEKSSNEYLILINLTWVHNETGVVWDLKPALKLKNHHLYIHVDAVQSVGKVSDYRNLNSGIDFYTYSGHKFGSLKGIGFSFISKKISLPPLLWGGGQQGGLRPGTENILGVQSLKWALSDYEQSWNGDELQANHLFLETEIALALKNKGEILFSETKRNLNTTYFYLNSLASDMALAIFDLEGLELSSGSACASGAAKKSAVMKKVGLEKLARNGLRLSHSPFLQKKEISLIVERFKKVLTKI